MTRPLLVLPEAEEGLADAMRFYETRRAGLGIEFLGAVDQVLARIEVAPGEFAPWPADHRSVARPGGAAVDAGLEKCALIWMASTLFHELLHLAGFPMGSSVPEHNGAASPCDNVYIADYMFSYLAIMRYVGSDIAGQHCSVGVWDHLAPVNNWSGNQTMLPFYDYTVGGPQMYQWPPGRMWP